MAGNGLIKMLRCNSTSRANSSDILLDGQPMYEKDTNSLYVGDGVTQAKNLQPIASGGGGITAANDISNAVVTLNYPSYVYDGQEHTVTARNIESVVLNGVTLNSFTDYGVSNAGFTSGVEAIGYPLVLVGAGNYTGQRAALWKIDKAVGTMTPNVSYVTLNLSQSKATVNIQWNGTGALSNVTATSSNSSVVGVSTNGTEISITSNIPGIISNLPGNATINVTCDKNNIDTNDISINVTIPSQLNTMPWNIIDFMSKNGLAETYFNIGDEITFTTKDSKEITMQIVGFNHDDLADGSGKAGITFGMKDLYYSTYPMNSSNTNRGGWEDCKMRTDTMQTMFENLPDELQAVIKTVNKKATYGSQSTSIATSQDKLWLYSQVEMFGGSSSGYVNEGTQYEYWVNHNTNSDRIKNLDNGTDSAATYWLRSPYTSNSTLFRYIDSDGDVTSYFNSNVPGGVCFCFCI